MIVNPRNLRDIFTAYDLRFQQGLGSVSPSWHRIAMSVPSSGLKTKLPWLNAIPGLRRWIGDRQIHALGTSVYEFDKNEYEDTVEVPIREIEADQYGIYAPYMQTMGEAYAVFPDETIWGALAAGFTTPCYDGQNLFSATHPVLDAKGKTVNISNLQSGSNPGWYLMVSNRAVKPLIWSPRKEEPFKQLTPQELVDRNKKMEYGCYVDAGVGYGFWQLIYASKATLDATNYAAARAAMMTLTSDYGRKLGLVPDLLMVPPALEGAARKIVQNQLAAGGETNEWAGTAEVLVSPWLS